MLIKRLSGRIVRTRRLLQDTLHHNQHRHHSFNSNVCINRNLSSIPPMSQAIQSIESPEFDDREYGQVTLQNGMVATLIHDPTLERSSCALAVDVGASADPQEYPGLAHFTEHMLFMGTEKYPEENYYKNFLSKNGGTSNASTSMESTVYKFDVNSAKFAEALDIFSQFFRNPLLCENSASREVRAVDAEDSKNRTNDGRRTLQILKSLIVESSTYSKYSTGNIFTLASGDADVNSPSTAKAMKEFYFKWYRSEMMAVALIGPQSLCELKGLAEEMFSAIPHQTNPTSKEEKYNTSDNTIGQADTNVYPFKQGGITVYINPVKDINQLNIMWGLPPTRIYYRSNPCRFLGHLLGHEGEGSTFEYLQNKGWITALSAGTRTTFKEFTIFQVSISLSPEGLGRWKEVVEAIYSYIRTMQTMTDEQIAAVWEEERLCDAVNFRFKMKGPSRELAASIAERTLRYPKEHVISCNYIHDEHMDISLLRNFLSRMIPGNEVCILSSKEFSWISDDDVLPHKDRPQLVCIPDAKFNICANRVEPWYGVHYFHEHTDEEAILRWSNKNPSLDQHTHIPNPNKYTPRSLVDAECRPSDSSDISRSRILRNIPVELDLHGSRGVCWWTEDIIFRHPRSAFYILLEPPFTKPTCRDTVASTLSQRLFSQLTATVFYPATIAGLHNSVSWSHRGIEITCCGYSHELPILIQDVVGQVKYFDPRSSCKNSSLFEVVREKYIRSLKSWTKGRPDSICEDLLRYYLQDYVWLAPQKISYAETLSIESLAVHTKQMFGSVDRFVTYSHGDFNASKAREISMDLMASVWPDNESTEYSSNDTVNTQRARLAPAGVDSSFMFEAMNPSDKNSALVCHFQAGSKVSNPRIDATVMVIHQLLKEPTFTTLRTKQQLGYIVSLTDTRYGRGVYKTSGLTVRILSNKYHPHFLKSALGKYLATQRCLFSDMTNDELRKRTGILVSNLEEPPSSYITEASTNWSRLIYGVPLDYRQQLIHELRNMTCEGLLSAADEWLFNQDTRRAVLMMICSDAHRHCVPSDFAENADELFKSGTGTDEAFWNIDSLLVAKERLEYPSLE